MGKQLYHNTDVVKQDIYYNSKYQQKEIESIKEVNIVNNSYMIQKINLKKKSLEKNKNYQTLPLIEILHSHHLKKNLKLARNLTHI